MMEFSPPKPPPRQFQRSKWFEVEIPVSPEDNVLEKPILVLKPFSATPHVSFHKVKVGCTKSCDLYLHNPLDISQNVRVEKIPIDKGFYLEEEVYILEPEEEKVIKIFWTPNKASNYRETIVFRTSTGCKTHAYLLGTAYFPLQKSSKNSSKPKKQIKKKASPKSAKISSGTSKNATVFNSSNFSEEKKENLDILNTKCDFFMNKSNHVFFKSPPKFESRTSFCLKSIDEYPDSPIRRQTYTINSMLSHGRESQILPIPSKDSFCNIKISNTLEKDKVETTLANNFELENVPKIHVNNTLLNKLSSEDNLNDSLENIGKNIGCTDFNDSLCNMDMTCDLDDMKDCVKTFDIVNKHLYFGYTPQQLTKAKTSNFSKQFECSRKFFQENSLRRSIVTPDLSNLTKQVNFSIETSNFDAFDSLSESKMDISIFDKYNCESLSLNETSFNFPVSEDSVFAHNVNKHVEKNCHDLTETNYEAFCKTSTVKEEFTSIDSDIRSQKKNDEKTDFYTCKESIVKDDVSAHLLKETKTSLFLEFPNDTTKILNPPAVSKFSKTTKKQSGPPSSVGHAFKKSSPLKKKPSPRKHFAKSRSAASNDSSLKSLSASSKVISGVSRNTENLTKRLPRKLCLIKPSRKSDAVIYQRNPFASMNVFYDERWIEKQETAFTTWLNFILTPNDDCNSEDVKVDSAKLWIESIKETSFVPAPTKEELSLKAYTAARNLNALRRASFSLYQSDDIVAVIKRIEREVDLKKINIRKDRAIHADLGIKKDILEMLLSYNPLWLRIGFETVYGEVITLQNNSDVLGLSRFIVHRFLNNPEISAKYLHPGVINYYKKGYEGEIQRFILKKFLLLVFFLDTAKNNHLIKHNPCLFNKNAKYKSSRSLLLAFSRDYLSGEGDITKHLRNLGCKVSYEQSALEEFDFSVRNLSVDLRCGLRLGRVVEILLQDWTISQNLRINTLNRLTKIHNNDVILKALKNAAVEIENNIEAKHIVDGYREKTLDLLWQIIFKTQISKLIDKKLLKKENAFLDQSLKLWADFAAYNALRNPECSSTQQEISIFDSKLYKENEILRLLFQWCRNVCAHYGIKVLNFTTSFSDGRVLCLLLHHYHPNVLPYECIKFETSNSYFEKQMKLAEMNENAPFYAQNDQSNTMVEKLLKNERENLTLVFQKFQEVGNIPILSRPSDMSNTIPDEKVTITLVSYVNIRLMELSIEIRAARKILHAWRKYKLKKQHERLKTEIKAVIIIQKAWKKYLNKKRLAVMIQAAVKIQSFWRMCYAKKVAKRLKEKDELALKNKASVCIQALVRGYLVRKRVSERHRAATLIQSYFRRWCARTHFMKLKNVTCRIQQNFRTKVIARAQRNWYISLHHNIIQLQAYSRGMLVRQLVRKKLVSIVKIQSYVRMWLTRKKYHKMRNACIMIQQKFRSYLLMTFLCEEYQNYRCAAISIQRWYRSMKIQQQKTKSAIKIQAYIRTFIVRKRFLILKQTVLKIQIWWRAVLAGRKARLDYKKTYQSIICLQSFVRQYVASQKYKKQKKSAVVIQKYIRGLIAKKKYNDLKKSITLIQNLWHSKCLARKIHSEYLSYRKKVIIVQSVVRCYIAVHNYKRIKQSVILIQKNVRALLLRKKFQRLKSCACIIQRKWRAVLAGRKARLDYMKTYQSIICLQSFARQYVASQKYKKQKKSAIIIQKYIRGFIAKKKYDNFKKNITLIQCLWRSKCLIKKVHSEYLSYRKKVIIVQSVVRRYIAMHNYKRIRQAVILVQKNVRALLLHKKFQRLKLCACIIQRKWRATLQARIAHSSYLFYRKKVIFIQSLIRKKIAYDSFNKKRHSAIIIQKNLRMIIERKRYLNLKRSVSLLQNHWRNYILACQVRRQFMRFKLAAVIIQSHYRMYSNRKKFVLLKKAVSTVECYRIGKIQRNKFLKMKESAVKLQSLFRSYLCKKQYLKSVRKIILIQSCIRRFVARRKYLKIRISAINIQRYFQSYKLKCVERERFCKIRNGIIKLQATFRGRCVRKHLKLLNENAIIIQSNYKRWKAQSEFKQLKQNCIIIQTRYRAKIEMKKQYHNYTKMRNSAIVIQSWWHAVSAGKKTRLEYTKTYQSIICIQSFLRQCIASSKYKKQKKSAIIIQKHIRGFLIKKRYCKLKRSVILIQNLWRSKCLARKIHSEYLSYRKKIIIVQSAVRRYIAVHNYKRIRQAVILAQKNARALLLHKKFQRLRSCVCIIQRKWRATLQARVAHSSYLLYRKKVILIQSLIRKKIAYQSFRKKKISAIVIQKYVRMLIQQKKYLHLRRSVILIQNHWRSYVLACHIRDEFLRLKLAAITIQSQYRMYSCRKRFNSLKKAVSIVECYRIGKIHRRNFLKMKESAIKLQSLYRSYICKKQYLNSVRRVILIQSYIRRVIAQRKYLKIRTSAINIQRFFRAYKLKHTDRERFLKIRNGIVKLQATYRGKYERKHLKLLNENAVIIQRNYKRWKAQTEFKLLQKSCLIIQTRFRAKIEMKKIICNYMKVKNSAIVIQAFVRGYFARKQYKLLKIAVIKIQSHVRMIKCYRKYHKMKSAVRTLKHYYKSYREMKMVRNDYLRKRSQVLYLQSKVRSFIARKKFLEKKRACILLQSLIRMKLHQRNYHKIYTSIIFIQRYYRNYKAMKLQRVTYMQQRHSVIYLQSKFRSLIARKRYLQQRHSVIYLQSKIRCMIARKEYLRKKAACILIQSFIRKCICQKKYSRIRNAAICIQSYYRRQKIMQLQTLLYIQLRKSKSLSSHERCPLTLSSAKVQHLWYNHLRSSTVHFQRAARTYLLKRHKAATVIQSHFRRYKIEKQFKELKAAIKIQACWRAYIVRRLITNKKVLEARKRIKAADSSETNKLKNRTSRSLDLLFKDSRISSMVVALEDLDVCTKLSPRCCERLVAAGGISILIQLLSYCNRSIPHMEIIKVTTNVLLNLAKYDKTVDFVWDAEESLSTILRLMRTFREKGTTIFNKCCSLLSIFCQDPAKVEIMKRRNDLIEEIRSFHYLLKRKQNLEDKQHVSRGLSNKSFLNKTSVASNISILQKDSIQIEPDWILGRNRCREFNDPLIGISYLMKVLELKSK